MYFLPAPRQAHHRSTRTYMHDFFAPRREILPAGFRGSSGYLREIEEMRLFFTVLVALPALALAQVQPQPEGPGGRQAEREAAQARRFMVAAANPHAVDAGVEILRRGGSVVDAAIAVQMVLGL